MVGSRLELWYHGVTDALETGCVTEQAISFSLYIINNVKFLVMLNTTLSKSIPCYQ